MMFCTSFQGFELIDIFGQWEFQDPKTEVPTIYKAYVRPM